MEREETNPKRVASGWTTERTSKKRRWQKRCFEWPSSIPDLPHVNPTNFRLFVDDADAQDVQYGTRVDEESSEEEQVIREEQEQEEEEEEGS